MVMKIVRCVLSFTYHISIFLFQEIAMILGPVTITAQRTEVVDFTYPYLEEDMVIGITIPQNSDGMFYIFNSLQWNIWLVIPITILVIGFATYLVQRWINCTDRTSIDGHIVLAFQAFTSQGKIIIKSVFAEI